MCSETSEKSIKSCLQKPFQNYRESGLRKTNLYALERLPKDLLFMGFI